MAEKVDRYRLRLMQAERRRNPAVFLRDMKRRGMISRIVAFLCQPGKP